MLAPDDRALLLDALRPPPGSRLERAVGTTFTLDLGTALTIPLAFAGHALSSTPDPIAVMEALRSSADVVDVFFQAGAVQATKWPSDLVALLEPVVHEVRRPSPGHLFHPKTWVAHYVEKSPEGEAIDAFRVLVLSRNLTGDRSWDVVARLDGHASRTRNRNNDGLARFVTALAEMSKNPLPDERREAILSLADKLRRVEWELPEGAREVRFWPFGLPGARQHDLDDLFKGYRHLVISPFVTAGGLDEVVRASGSGTDATVVSRPEELDRLARGALDSRKVFVINPLAGLDPESGEPSGAATGVAAFGALHAKVVLVEVNRRARLFLGSANATDAAFGGNVEMMIELEGRPGQLGIDLMLGDKAEFRTLLEEYHAPDQPIVDDAAELGRKLDAYLVDAAQLRYTIAVADVPEGWRPTISTAEEMPAAPIAVEILLRPFNRPLEQTRIVAGVPLHIELGPRAAADVTPFLVLTARSSLHGQDIERATVVKAAILGGPSDRLGEILVRQIDSPEKFLRLLFLLLGLGDDFAAPAIATAGVGGGGAWGVASAGIFETLVRALATDASAIDRLDEIVRRLRTHEEGRRVLPEGWDRVWEAVLAARKLIGARA